MRFVYTVLIIGAIAALLRPALGQDDPTLRLPRLTDIPSMSSETRLDNLQEAIEYELELQVERREVINAIERRGWTKARRDKLNQIKGWQKTARKAIHELANAPQWTVTQGYRNELNEYLNQLYERLGYQNSRIAQFERRGIQAPPSYYASRDEIQAWIDKVKEVQANIAPLDGE